MNKSNKSKPKDNNTSKENKNIQKIVLVGVGLTATGIAGYFGYQYLKKLKEAEAGQNKQPVTSFTPPAETPVYNNSSNTNSSNTSYEPPAPPKQPTYTPPKSSSNTYTPPKPKAEFPLKKGSKGTKVMQLQQALIATYGKSILPKWGADGDFGSELAKALKKLNHPATISESLFHVITGGKATDTSLAKQFYSALNQTNYTATMALLKQLQNKTDYTVVSNEFKALRLHGGVRQTLVNGVLNTFADATQKQNIRMEFLRMGLKYNGKKWSLDGLNGIGGKRIITTQPAQVWLDGFSSMQVPPNMILGTAMAERLDFTLFENKGRYFLVKTNSIKTLSN